MSRSQAVVDTALLISDRRHTRDLNTHGLFTLYTGILLTPRIITGNGRYTIGYITLRNDSIRNCMPGLRLTP